MTDIATVIYLLDEARGFAALSPAGRKNISEAIDILEELNARRAAPVEGLDTVGYVTTSPTGAEVFQRKPLVPGHGQFGYKQDAVVTRSQADELLAAERAETMRQVKHWSELYKQQHYRAEKAEAIIAAKDAALTRIAAFNGIPLPGSFAAEIARKALGIIK